MPDVSRSDSNRSDASRPRVSFNRNVHVKRINAPKIANAYSLSTDGTTFVPTSIRRERPKTKMEMTKEAEVVLKHVDKLSTTTARTSPPPNNKVPDEEKQKTDKKRKKTFSFLRKIDRSEKAKTSSSDVESGSSQEYRVYRVNAPAEMFVNSALAVGNNDSDMKKVKKIYDFMSLDRRRLKKAKEKESLDYLSLEKNKEALNKMKTKRKPNNTLLSVVFDRMETKGRKTPEQQPQTENKEHGILKLQGSNSLEEPLGNKKPLSPIIEKPGPNYLEKRKRENNANKMAKRTSEKGSVTLTQSTERLGRMREPQNDSCHNENIPYSYTNEGKSYFEEKPGAVIAESLGDSQDGSKSTSPTNDVIYAQVIVGGRDGNVQKVTVNERVSDYEVGNVFVGEDSHRPSVGTNHCKIDSVRNAHPCQIATVNSDENSKEDKESKSLRMSAGEAYGNPVEKRIHHASPNFQRDDHTRIVRVPTRGDFARSPTDLHDLSIRREILLSRSESQAKERFNSLKRLQQPSKVRRNVSNGNGIKTVDKPLRNDSQMSGDEVRHNEKPDANIRKKREENMVSDSRKGDPTAVKKKRESKLDAYLREKSEIWKNIDKVHVIKTDDDDDDNLLRKLSRLGKSKSFIQDKPKAKRMNKMKMLFKKKKGEKGSESEEDPLSARYLEYRGSDVEFSDRSTDSSPRRTFSRRPPTNGLAPSKAANLRFFGDTDQESTKNEIPSHDIKKKRETAFPSNKLTDSDEDQVIRSESKLTPFSRKESPTGKSKSKCDLDKPDYGVKQMNHSLNIAPNKYEASKLPVNFDNYYSAEEEDICEINGMKFEPRVKRSVSSLTNATKYEAKEKLRNLKSTPAITLTTPNETLSRRVKSHGNLYTQEDRKGGRRRLYDSSAESATEGDSSHHSSKSMIYLHAATVGDIPGPRNAYKQNKRSQSREELNSMGDVTANPSQGKKTLSRSFSVLAPWRPRHDKEDRTLHYDSAVDFNRGKPPTGMSKAKSVSERKERKSGELRFNTIGKENRRRKDLVR